VLADYAAYGPFDDGMGKVAGFLLHARVAAKSNERRKLEWLCRLK
jgi:hypothetical protein